jgi:hypothetical protein
MNLKTNVHIGTIKLLFQKTENPEIIQHMLNTTKKPEDFIVKHKDEQQR